MRMHAALWIGQGILGAVFTTIGAIKLLGSMPDLQAKFGFPEIVGEPMTRFIGASELAGGVGVIVPAAARVAPWLTPLAAGGLAVVMLAASGFHLARHERAALAKPLALGALAGVVAWGRARRWPISSIR